MTAIKDSATGSLTPADRRRSTEPRKPSRSHLLYLANRSESAERMYRIAKAQRLGATVINRRFRTWALRRGELEAAMKEAAA